jgi:hypothetical protein
MRRLKVLLCAAALLTSLTFIPKSNAQIYVNIGAPPVCPYGYYDYAPYACAPPGFYGPGYFYNGIFLGVGPWHYWGYRHGWRGHRFVGPGGGMYGPGRRYAYGGPGYHGHGRPVYHGRPGGTYHGHPAGRPAGRPAARPAHGGRPAAHGNARPAGHAAGHSDNKRGGGH